MWTEFLSISFKIFGFASVILSIHFYPWMIFRALPPRQLKYILIILWPHKIPWCGPSAAPPQCSVVGVLYCLHHLCLLTSSDLHNLQVLLVQILRDRRAATFWRPSMTIICFPINSFNLFSPEVCEDTSFQHMPSLKYSCLSWRVLYGFVFIFWVKNETALHPYVGFCGHVLFIGGLERGFFFIDTPAAQ